MTKTPMPPPASPARADPATTPSRARPVPPTTPLPPEIPPTSRAAAAPVVAGMVLAGFLAAGALANLWAFGVQDNALLSRPPTLASVLDGDVTAEIGKALATSPLPEAAARAERALSWRALGDLGPRVRHGCDDWLFLSDELMVHPGGEANARARAELVRRTADRLRGQGIALQVAVVPDKSRIQAADLCGIPRAGAMAPRVSTWVDELRAAGVAALDLSPALAALPDDAFLRTDTHWTPAGAQAAAAAVASTLRPAPPANPAGLPARAPRSPFSGEPLPDGPATSGASAPGPGAGPPAPQPDAFTPRQITVPHPGPVAPRPGDLVRLAGLADMPAAWQPAPDQVATTRFTVVDGAQAATADDLFGDTQLPSVALVGSSYSGVSDFVPWLAHALQTPVASFAKDGGGFAGAISAYVASAAYRDTPPSVLIWEIPERDLQAPAGAGEAALAAWLAGPGR